MMFLSELSIIHAPNILKTLPDIELKEEMGVVTQVIFSFWEQKTKWHPLDFQKPIGLIVAPSALLNG